MSASPFSTPARANKLYMYSDMIGFELVYKLSCQAFKKIMGIDLDIKLGKQ